jgi:hypothetical protein
MNLFILSLSKRVNENKQLALRLYDCPLKASSQRERGCCENQERIRNNEIKHLWLLYKAGSVRTK